MVQVEEKGRKGKSWNEEEIIKKEETLHRQRMDLLEYQKKETQWQNVMIP